MIRTLITGSEGFVGSYLQNKLCNSVHKKGKFLVKKFDLQLGNDIRNYEEIRNTVSDFQPDLIFHLAAQAFVPESNFDVQRGLNTNLMGTLNLLNAVRNTGTSCQLVITGTSEEYGYARDDLFITEQSLTIPTSIYGVTKLAATTLAIAFSNQFGLHTIVTRAWNHIGPGSSPSYAVSAFAKRIAEAEKYGTAVEHGNLDTKRNYTDVSDIVDGYISLIGAENGVYNLASQNTYSINEILKKLASFSSKKLDFKENTNLHRSNDLRFPTPNCEKIFKATGWYPRIPFEKTLKSMLDFWREKI